MSSHVSITQLITRFTIANNVSQKVRVSQISWEIWSNWSADKSFGWTLLRAWKTTQCHRVIYHRNIFKRLLTQTVFLALSRSIWVHHLTLMLIISKRRTNSWRLKSRNSSSILKSLRMRLVVPQIIAFYILLLAWEGKSREMIMSWRWQTDINFYD